MLNWSRTGCQIDFEAANLLQRSKKLIGIERLLEDTRRPRPTANLSRQLLFGQKIQPLSTDQKTGMFSIPGVMRNLDSR
jgi:hypothetical protein